VVTATKTSAGTVSGYAASGVDEDDSEGGDQSRMALQSGVAAAIQDKHKYKMESKYRTEHLGARPKNKASK
jgi:hypothetical protein